jgi:hypothetical protein
VEKQILYVTILMAILIISTQPGFPAMAAEPQSATPGIIWMPLMNFTSISIGPSDSPQKSSVSSSVNEEYLWPLVVNVLVVCDEEFRSRTYEAPWFKTLDWKDYVMNVIERADDRLNDVFNIDINIVQVSTWESDNSKSGEDLLLDAIHKTGFVASKTVINGQVIHVLIAWTGQYLGFTAGAYVVKRAIIMTANAYWADDNILRHEISHLFGASDHKDANDPDYFEDCIMSYRFVHVEYWVEDNWIWYIGNDVVLAALSDNWCTHCQNMIFWKKGYFLVSRAVSSHWYIWR